MNKRCPVGGIDRSSPCDRIDLRDAVETPFWMAVWAGEPTRMIDVHMSYSDLKIICDLIDEKRKEAEKHKAMENVIDRHPTSKITFISVKEK